jgi:hypothetical protein
VGTKEAAKGGDKVQAVILLGRQVFGIRGGVNDLQFVTQPLNGGS